MIEKIIKKPDKKSLCYLAIVLAVVLLVSAGLLYYLSRSLKIEAPEEKPAGKSTEEIIRDLTAPRGEPEPLSGEIINDLTAPRKGEKPTPLSEEIINNLTAPK